MLLGQRNGTYLEHVFAAAARQNDLVAAFVGGEQLRVQVGELVIHVVVTEIEKLRLYLPLDEEVGRLKLSFV